jgi:lysophospholipase L1-like esterase
MRRFVNPSIAALAAAALGCGAPGAVDEQGLRNPPTYLALGDSVPFGYDPLVIPPPNDNVFYATAYPWYLAQLESIPLVDAACPGQTSASFSSLTAPDNGCFEFRAAYGLHVDYSGTQLEFALGYLATHTRVRFITIALGANDLFMLDDACAGDATCILGGIGNVLGAIGQNVAGILGALRAAGYEGQIVVPLYYNPVPSELFAQAVQALDYQVLAPVAAAFGADTVDLYAAYVAASAQYGGDPCAAGLLIPLPDGTCDVHPSAAGAELIAATIAPVVAAWTGKP